MTRPLAPPALWQRAIAHLQADRLSEARATLEELLAGQPRRFEVLNLLGIVAARQQDHATAIILFERAIAADPGQPGAYNNLGLAQQAQTAWAAALESFDRAIALKPEHAAAHFNRGNVLKDLGRSEDALASYARATALQPGFAEAHYNHGVLLAELGRSDAALASFDRAVSCRGDFAEAHFNRGTVLLARGSAQAALESFDRAVAARGHYPEALLNRGEALERLDRPALALASYERALEIHPRYAKAHYNRGNLHKSRGEFTAAVTSYEHCLALEPNHADAHFNRALALLASGDFERGWLGHEWRWRNSDAPPIERIKTFAEPLWLGREDLRGKTLLVHWEQGLGDTLHFCRYASVLADRGIKVVFLVQPRLAPLLEGLAGVARLVPEGEPLPQFDAQCPLMSLPLALGTRLETIPGGRRYLSADPSLKARWQERLGPRRAPRVGLAWYGNPAHAGDRRRSLALADLLPHLPPDCRYVSLQQELREADRLALDAAASRGHEGGSRIESFPGELDWPNTAALIECLDLVVSVDTSLAHLSGALGQRTWVLLSADPDWRWLRDRADSPWYPSATLYRQPRPRDWSSVLARVRADLQALAAGPDDVHDS